MYAGDRSEGHTKAYRRDSEVNGGGGWWVMARERGACPGREHLRVEWQCILTFAWSLPFVERSCAAQRDHAITLFVRMTPAIETLLKYRRTSSPCCRGSSAPCLPGLADA